MSDQLKTKIAEIIDHHNAVAGGGDQGSDAYDLDAIVRDVRKFNQRRALRDDSPAEHVSGVGLDMLLGRLGAYRLDGPTGDRIEHDDVLDRERRAALLSEMFGNDAPPMKSPARRMTVERPAPDVGWPSAFEHAEAEKQRLRDTGHNL